jgi:ligand-binding sensor domain-containing protein
MAIYYFGRYLILLFMRPGSSCARIFSSLLLLCTVLAGLRAGAQTPLTRNYTVRDGLPSSETHDIFQDSEGYIWVASDRGVCRFDGYGFEVFDTGNGLPDNTIFEVYEDYKHRIWFRSYSGRMSYYYNGKIHALSINEELARSHRNVNNTSIYVDGGDTLWLGTRTHFMLRVTLRDSGGKIDVLEQPLNGYIKTFADGGCIWGGDLGRASHSPVIKNHVVHYDAGNITSYELKEIIQNVTGTPVMLYRSNKSIMVGSADRLYDLSQPGGQPIMFPASVIAIREDRAGDVWVYSRLKGLFCYRGGDISSKPEIYFKDMFITDIYQDTEGAYWFSTLSNGVLYMSSRDIRNYSNNVTDKNVRCISRLGDRSVAVGYNNSCIQLFDSSSEQQQLINDIGVGNILGIDFIPGWGTWISGTNMVVQAKGLFGAKQPVPITAPKKILIESDTSILFITTTELIRVNRKNKATHVLPGYSYRFFSAFIDSRKALWLGTFNGLVELDDDRKVEWGSRFGLLKSRISAITEPENGELWISTIGQGVLILDLNKDTVRQLTTRDGLASDVCNTLFVDSKGIIWAGTNKGLTGITRNPGGQLSFRNISIKNGLVSNEVNSICEAEGKLWVGTTEGLSVLDPVDIKPDTLSPPVHITSISIHSLRMPVQPHYDLEYDQNFISLRFVGLSYRNAGSVQYKIKMEGIDKDWIYTTQPTIQYTTVPPGRYRFTVYAMNNNGVWSAKPAVISFTISPPYWETAWFRIVIACALLGMITMIFTIRYRYLKRTEQEKNELYRKIVDTELKALRAQMNPHFIFNSLNSIQRFILESDTQGAHKYLGKFSKLVRKTLNNSRKEMIPLSEELETLRLYIELESLRFKDKFSYVIEPLEDIDAEDIKVPALIIQPFVENAIWHGLMPMQSKGRLLIKLEATGNAIKCKIEDNGIGREAAAQSGKLHKGHESMGITVTKERLEALNAKYGIESTLSITDIYNNDGTPGGTKVELFCPLIYSI